MPTVAILRYLAVPLRASPLLLIGIFSFLLMLAAVSGLTGIPLALIVLSWFFKYAFVVLDAVVDGLDEPPTLAIEMVNPVGDQRALILVALVAGLYFLFGAVSDRAGQVLAVLVVIAGASLLPAMIAVQGVSGNLIESFDPRTWFKLMRQLGADYTLLLGCAVSFGLIGHVLVASDLANAMPAMLRIALLMYGWLAMFALIGGALFERRLEIGLEATHAPERIEAKRDAEIDRVRSRQIDIIYAEWRGGGHANAWKTITTHLERSTDALAELRWIYQRAAGWPDSRLAGRLAQEILPRLLSAHQTGAALDIVRERLAANAEFRPLSSADLLTLVRLAREAGDRRTARALLHDFGRFYPNDPGQLMADTMSKQLAP